MDAHFLQTIQRLSRIPFGYENDYEAQERALEVIPLEKFYEIATVRHTENPEWAVEDYVVQELVHWFKHDFFKWVNAPKCESCNVCLMHSRRLFLLGKIQPQTGYQLLGSRDRILGTYFTGICDECPS